MGRSTRAAGGGLTAAAPRGTLPRMHWRTYAAHPALAGYAALEHGPARMLLRRGLEPHAALLGRDGPPPAEASVAGGRAAHPVVPLPDGRRAVVRAYRRGGAVRHLLRARYLAGHRAFAELLATETARRGGVRVPDVLAAVERRMPVGYEAALATAWIPGAVESAAWLASAPPAARMAMLREAGRQVARMHLAGVAHPDLNLRNLLVVSPDSTPSSAAAGRDAVPPPDPSAASSAEMDAVGHHPSANPPQSPDADAPLVYVIDFDRARLYGGPVPAERCAADLRRLARSARKLRGGLGADGWRALAAGYGDAWPLDPEETARLG
jgi:3-deoxy-D-manno-octulosonic acid kinase